MIEITFVPKLEKKSLMDLLVIPFWEEGTSAGDIRLFKEIIEPALKSGDFKGKNGEALFLYGKEGKILLLGLGKEEKLTVDLLRRAYASAVRTVQSKKGKAIHLLIPSAPSLETEELLRGIAEGLFLTNYAFSHLKHDTLKENPTVLLEKVCFVGLDKKQKPFLDQLQTIAEGVFFARDLVNGNADDVTPQMLAETAKSFESSKIKTTIFDKKWMEEKGMGLILAVNRSSPHDPFLIQTTYKGNPKSKEHIVLVGKGITYDTGGLSLKPTDGMLTMKCDMSGAATVLAAVKTAAALDLKVNITAIAPVTENAIGSKSYKLGDVYRSYSGKTVEITNTDAEGRLVLADALSYAIKQFKPTCVIDFASLTGAMVIALGEEMAGFFATDEKLAKELQESSERTGEWLWRMPLYQDYKEAYKSDIADIVNSAGRDAGAIKGALFLQEFVGNTPWVHIDFAGPCFLSKPKHYYPTKATGSGVRLLLDFLTRRVS